MDTPIRIKTSYDQGKEDAMQDFLAGRVYLCGNSSATDVMRAARMGCGSAPEYDASDYWVGYRAGLVDLGFADC